MLRLTLNASSTTHQIKKKLKFAKILKGMSEQDVSNATVREENWKAVTVKMSRLTLNASASSNTHQTKKELTFAEIIKRMDEQDISNATVQEAKFSFEEI